jgi:putative ABC transport system permease protein
MIGVLGFFLGLLISYLTAFFIEKTFELPFEFSPGWIVTAFIIAIGGSLVGALYPAWRASGIDPVEVMVNE